MEKASSKRGSKRAAAKFSTDPLHAEVDIFAQDITLDVWRDKYRWEEEDHPYESMRRVVEGVYAKDPSAQAKWDALEAMQQALWVPGGRIHAGAGTSKVVTLINCYVDRTIEDSMNGIADALKDAMLTMQQGGGIGMDFSTLRPSGAYLHRTGAIASGPLPFMDMWDSMCATIMSAGSRRGAMMGVMHCEHPDLARFIAAKQEHGKLTNFNISVLVTDAFLDAVENDEDWYLGFGVPRADGKHYFHTERDDDYHQGPWYAYEKWRAKDLWELILKNTYEWSEPGVIFIDRINDENNLQYCETISCTNPCGEQPLPPNGACNLGAVNLARMVRKPFTSQATFDFKLLRNTVTVGTRFLDNVIDTTLYPLEAQKQEEENKRRIGLGIMGLANALVQLRLPYGSEGALATTNEIMQTIMEMAYATSAELAIERGSFPFYEADKWGKNSAVVKSLSRRVKNKIRSHGIRNGVLLTIAPTGTTALYMGNVSSGLEPVFLHKLQRNVRQPDGSYKMYDSLYDYGYLLYARHAGKRPEQQIELPDYMVTHEDLTVMDHVRMQAACQTYIDASVSKTINCPEELSFEDFKEVYNEAYQLGCKGCTTYRPSDVRGSVLSSGKTKASRQPLPPPRPKTLSGQTHKVKWPHEDSSYYITINHHEYRPHEIFIHSTSSKYTDWTTALSLMISAIMRRGDDISFIPEELKKVVSVNDYGWVGGKFYGSLVALIGDTLGKHINGDHEKQSVTDSTDDPNSNPQNVQTTPETLSPNNEPNHGNVGEPNSGLRLRLGEFCPSCENPTLIPQDGCKTCIQCGYSNCG